MTEQTVGKTGFQPVKPGPAARDGEQRATGPGTNTADDTGSFGTTNVPKTSNEGYAGPDSLGGGYEQVKRKASGDFYATEAGKPPHERRGAAHPAAGEEGLQEAEGQARGAAQPEAGASAPGGTQTPRRPA